jgi:hypothetical protein
MTPHSRLIGLSLGPLLLLQTAMRKTPFDKHQWPVLD